MHFSSMKKGTAVAHLLIITAALLQEALAVQIQSGDTLANLAAEHGLSVAALEAANPGISVDNLQVGQAVNVPGTKAGAVATTVSQPPKTIIQTTTASPPPSTAAPAPAPPTPAGPPPASTADLTSVGSPSCAPSPIGKYVDADSVQLQTDPFCDRFGHLALADLWAAPYFGLLSGDSQGNNGDDGNGGLASNEKGFNMTIRAVTGCVYPPGNDVKFTLGQPMGNNSSVDWACEAVLLNCYNECNNKGMGGQLQAGCFLYLFESDP